MKTLLKWTPRAIAVAFGAYYGLGIAYDLGLMAILDRFAIHILKQTVGYAGLGALMPTFQWYMAISVRCFFGLIAGLSYDLIARAIRLALPQKT